MLDGNPFFFSFPVPTTQQPHTFSKYETTLGYMLFRTVFFSWYLLTSGHSICCGHVHGYDAKKLLVTALTDPHIPCCGAYQKPHIQLWNSLNTWLWCARDHILCQATGEPNGRAIEIALSMGCARNWTHTLIPIRQVLSNGVTLVPRIYIFNKHTRKFHYSSV